jgi:hypothetical protein
VELAFGMVVGAVIFYAGFLVGHHDTSPADRVPMMFEPVEPPPPGPRKKSAAYMRLTKGRS